MASPATEVSQGGHPAAFCSASTNLHDNLNDTGPLKLPFFHSFASSNLASPSRASTTPFRLFPLHRFCELELNASSPGGVELPPARTPFELAQPICRRVRPGYETGRENASGEKRNDQRENGEKPRKRSIEREGKTVAFVAPPSLLRFGFFSLPKTTQSSNQYPTLFSLSVCREICGGFSRMSRTVVRHSRVPMGAYLFLVF